MKSCPSHEAMPFSMQHCLVLWYSAWSLQKCTFLMKQCSFLWNHAFCLIQWPTYKNMHISMKQCTFLWNNARPMPQCPSLKQCLFHERIPFVWNSGFFNGTVPDLFNNALSMKQRPFLWNLAFSTIECSTCKTMPFLWSNAIFYEAMPFLWNNALSI